METPDTAAQRRERLERETSALGMLMLTGGLTSEGDTFLIACAAVLATSLLYSLIGVWSMLAFPAVFLAAVFTRSRLRKRRRAASTQPETHG